MPTACSLFNGKLIIHQEERGYRFSLDAVLLAGLTAVKPGDRVADLGTGCGVVALVMAYRNPDVGFVGVELQPELAALARRNVRENGFDGRGEIVEADFRRLETVLPPESFDLVVGNPPYRAPGSGKVNPDGGRAAARHEITGSVTDLFIAGRRILKHGGRMAVVYPATRADHLMAAAREHGFRPKTLTVVYTRSVSGPARLVVLECRKGGGDGLRIEPPFFIYGEGKGYTEGMLALYEA